MLRYRVAYDPECGHFVLPALPTIISPAVTFASRGAAQKNAQARNARAAEPSTEPAPESARDSRFLRTFLRRA